MLLMFKDVYDLLFTKYDINIICHPNNRKFFKSETRISSFFSKKVELYYHFIKIENLVLNSSGNIILVIYFQMTLYYMMI